jgi:hypothetical protein
MPTMSMNKVIHLAFRRDLDRFVSALDAFAPGDTGRAAGLGRAWANFDEMLSDHHEGEHEIAWPHLERAGVPRALLGEMDAEHEVMAGALQVAREEMNGLARDPSAARAAAARQAMGDLRVATVRHLDHEESEIESFYLEHSDHPEIKAMGREFGKRSPAFAGRFFAWVTDGASPQEQAAFKENVPGPVFAVMSSVWGRGYRKEVAPVWR